MSYNNSSGPGSAPKRMKLSEEPPKPSRVLHIYGLPTDATEAEIILLTQLFGQVNNIILTRTKNQALVEMSELEMAKQMVEYYRQVPARIRTHTVHVQYSNHENLRVELRPIAADLSSEGGDVNSSQTTQAHNVLRIIVDNMLYPVTLETLFVLFSKYGKVLRIITFTKNNSFHALVEFQEPIQAQSAKMSLNGQNIFHGCCSLHIDFSKLRKLSIRYNNDKSRDFTNDSLPNDEDPNGYHGGAAMFSGGFDGPQRFGGGGFPRNWSGHGHQQGPSYGARGGGHHQHSANSPVLLVSNLNENNKRIILIVSVVCLFLFGTCALWYMCTLTRYTWSVIDGELLSVMYKPKCLFQKVTPDTLFTLFGVYGDVLRVKILFNKKDSALVQFSDGVQAQRAIDNLDFVRVWDKQMKLSVSKMHKVQMPKDDQPGAELTQDYSDVPAYKHRFRNPHSKSYMNIAPPSDTLHLANIPPGTKDDDLKAIFDNFGKVVDFKFFEKNPKMALIQLKSTEEAVMALIGMHNFQLGSNYLTVSFTRNRILQMNNR